MSRWHVIREGESVVTLAEAYGFLADTIWRHPSNAGLRALRRRMNVLMPGDQVFIPDPRPRVAECATGRTHLFRRRGVPALLRLRLTADGAPRAGVAFRFESGQGTRTGVTDGDGRLEIRVPTGARIGKLFVGSDEPLLLQLNGLLPLETVRGVQQRLRNLGYDCAESGENDGATRAALVALQLRNGLEPTGECDEATRDCLEAAHDEMDE